MTPRQAYVAKRLTVLVLIGLAVAGWVHGIYWAGGINQPGNNWRGGGVPWQAALIDFAPVWVLLGGMFASEGAAYFLEGYRRLPNVPAKEQRVAAKQAEREATIARLERELGLVEPMPAPPCSHRYRRRLMTAGFPDREVCERCGVVFEGWEGDWHE